MGPYRKAIAALLTAIVGMVAMFWPGIEEHAQPETIGAVASVIATVLVYLVPNAKGGFKTEFVKPERRATDRLRSPAWLGLWIALLVVFAMSGCVTIDEAKDSVLGAAGTERCAKAQALKAAALELPLTDDRLRRIAYYDLIIVQNCPLDEVKALRRRNE